jgi:hypothetical protein
MVNRISTADQSRRIKSSILLFGSSRSKLRHFQKGPSRGDSAPMHKKFVQLGALNANLKLSRLEKHFDTSTG